MKMVFRTAVIAFGLVAIIPCMAPGGEDSSKDLTLYINASPDHHGTVTDRLSLGLERELRRRDYTGEVTVINTPDSASSGQCIAKITLLKSAWQTQKAFSIPYLLNRYRRMYCVEVELAIGSDSLGFEIFKFKADEKSKVEAQLFTNDKLDADLFAGQSEKIAIENRVWLSLARSMAKKVGEKAQ